jgi:threonyl-tRNA synthetase
MAAEVGGAEQGLPRVVRLVLPGGAEREVAGETTARDLAAALWPEALSDAVAARFGSRVVDLGRPLGEVAGPGPVSFALLSPRDPQGLEVYRHTTAHVLAQAVRRLYPGTHLAIGPVIEDGFYYDMDVRDEAGRPVRLAAEDLPRLEAAMAEVVAEDLPVSREVIGRERARALFAAAGEEFKVEIVDGLPADAEVTLYRQGEFADLCRGPHLPSTGRIAAFKLLSVAGAYWRGDERRPMLQRVYGTAFPERQELERHLWVLEEARKRDHRRLGPELGLFLLRDEAPGFPFWLPHGYTLWRLLENWSRELQAELGYQEVRTPLILRSELWERSGHWGHYQENMFTLERDGERMAVKPMNCPAHCLLFSSQTRSYRDLPLRFAEYAALARYERSGTLHGLLRVRSLHQDDAHIFCTPEQVGGEIAGVFALCDRIYGTLGMEYEIRLATRPENSIGDPALWERAEADLAAAARASGREFSLAPGEGAFYGPKLEWHVTDALGRRWQCATAQLDFNFPERFDLWYAGADGQRHRPLMIHRAIFGSLERFIGVLIEHFGGAFPAWLAPVQALVLPIAERHGAYAARVAATLAAAGLRAEVDGSGEKIGYRIRQGRLRQVPYLLVAGDREQEAGTVAVRCRTRGDLGPVPLAAFVADLRAEVASRALGPAGA